MPQTDNTPQTALIEQTSEPAPDPGPDPAIEEILQNATSLLNAGRLHEAEQLYRQIVALRPRQARIWHLLGLIAHQDRRFDAAAHRIGNAIRINDKDARSHCDLGLALQAQGRLAECIPRYRQALALDPNYPEAQYNLGNALMAMGKLDEAAEHYDAALALKPGYAEAHCNLSAVFSLQGKLDEAASHVEQAAILRPDMPEAHFNLGHSLQTHGRHEEAATCFRQALALRPDYAEAHYNLGLAMRAQDKLDEAVTHYERALAIHPRYSEAHKNLAIALDARNEWDASIAHFQTALSLNPDSADAHVDLAMAQLRSGDFLAGWRNYEWRWRSDKSRPSGRDLPQPQWRGEPLNGARILLHAEQGLGDTIQFLRYLPMVQAAGGTVVLDVQDRLRRIAAELPGVADLVSGGDSLPPFDCHCPLLSLPFAFGTTLETNPRQVPYLSIPQQARQAAAALPWPTTGLRVGVAWAGDPKFLRDRHRYRSIPFPLLKPLFDRRDVHLFSLQIGGNSGADELSSSGMTDLAPYVSDMADTAAQIAHLDLVVSIDTSVAHLAGALGVATWTLLPYCSDWRWHTGDESPWYPTMRIFRQPNPGDWESVIARVCGLL